MGLEKEQGQQRSEKIAKLRELRKYGKKVQVEVQLKRQKEKKDTMDEMKKIKKGHGGNLDFLDDEGGKVGDKKAGGGNASKRMSNDKKSFNDVGGKMGGPSKKLGKGKQKRPGKDKR